MTQEEALAKVVDVEARNLLSKIITDQNKYIGQLEQVKNSPKTTTDSDDITRKYLEKNMRRDVIEEATQTIKQTVGEEIFNAVQQDFIAFLDKTMKKENTTVNYCVDAFSLVYGQCLMKKDHPVHNVGKGTTPQVTTPQTQSTNGQSIATVQKIIANQPPIISDKDSGVGSSSGLPDTSIQVKSTRDAFKGLKDRFGLAGSNKFQ